MITAKHLEPTGFQDDAIRITPEDVAAHAHTRILAEIAQEERQEDLARRRPVHFDALPDARQLEITADLIALIEACKVPAGAARTMAVTLAEDVFAILGVPHLRVQVPAIEFDTDPNRHEGENYLKLEPRLYPLAEGVALHLDEHGPIAEHQRRIERWVELSAHYVAEETAYKRRLAEHQARKETRRQRAEFWKRNREQRALCNLVDRLLADGDKKDAALVEAIAHALASEPLEPATEPGETAGRVFGWVPL